MVLSVSMYVFMLVYLIAFMFIFIVEDLFILWVVMETLIMLFMTLSLLDTNALISSLMAYYVIQSLASVIILLGVIIFVWSSSFSLVLFESSMFLNLGIFPLFSWYPGVTMGLSDFSLVLVLTLQNLPPLVLNNVFMCQGLYFSNVFVTGFMLLAIVGSFVGGVGALSSLDFRSLLVWSSLSNSGWLYMVTYLDSISLFSFFWVYTLLVVLFLVSFSPSRSLSFIFLYCSLMSLIGFPPFPLFFIKLYVIFSFSILLGGVWWPLLTLTVLLSSVVLLVIYFRFLLFLSLCYIKNNLFSLFLLKGI